MKFIDKRILAAILALALPLALAGCGLATYDLERFSDLLVCVD